MLDAGAAILADAAVDTPRRAARWLLEDILETGAASLLAYPEAEASTDEVEAFIAALARCQRQEPLQYVLGYAVFCGLKLRVTPDVLIPRAETELLVHAALEGMAQRSDPHVLDMGCGSGCIALALKHARSDAHVVGCDISRAALQVAQGNAQQLGLSVSLLHADIFSNMRAVAELGPFDMIVSNPPYIPDVEVPSLPANVRDFEPELAFACGGDPLRFYGAIAAASQHLLQLGGCLLLEVHASNAERVRKLLVDHGFAGTMVRQDLAGRPRIVVAERGSNG